MTCRNCLALLAAHWDEPRTEVANHLRECGRCHAQWARLTAALELLEREPRPAAPDLRAGIWARIEAPAPRIGERWLGLGGVAAMLAVVWWRITPLVSWPDWSTLSVDLSGWWPAARVAVGALPARLDELAVWAGIWWRELLSGTSGMLAPATAGGWMVVAGLLGATALEAVTRRAAAATVGE